MEKERKIDGHYSQFRKRWESESSINESNVDE